MTDPEPPPEMRLLLACARKKLSAFHPEHIVELCHRPLDWRLFLNLVDRHRVAPLVWHSLHAVDPLRLPDTVRDALRRRVEYNTRRMLLLGAELSRLVRLLEQAGIRVMPLKGPVLALQVYGNLALRHAGDLDLLVDPCCVQKARQVLADADYIQTHPPFELTPVQTAAFMKIHHDFGYTHKSQDIYVELHWRWSENAYLFPLNFEQIWHKRQSLIIAGVRMAVMAPEDLLPYLCVHGAKHAWFRLRWLCDIAELLDNGFSIDMDRLIERSNKLGVSRMLAQGLLLAHQVLNAPLPASVSQVIQQDSTVRTLAQVAYQALMQDERYWLPTATLLTKPKRMLYLLRLRTDLKYKWYSLFHRLLNIEDWQTIRLPAWLFALYFILRPLLWIDRQLKKHYRRSNR